MFDRRQYAYTPLEKPHHGHGQRLLRFLPCLKVMIITCVCLMAFCFYGRTHFYRDPESIFFNPKTGYTRNYSLVRENEALDFLRSTISMREEAIDSKHGQITLQAGHVGVRPHICAVISSHGSMRGQQRHPIELTLASLLSGLSQSERTDLDLRVFIANSDPSSHPFVNSPLSSLVDRVASAKDVANQELIDRLALLEQQHEVANKSAIDISLALEHCFLNSTAPYIAFFEDDIVAADSWFARTRLALRDANKLAEKHGQQWLDLRLFNAANEIRWTANKTPLQQAFMYMAIVFVVATVSSTVIVFNRTARRLTGVGMPDRSALTIALITIPLFTIILIRAGKSNLIPRPDGVSIQPWGCCTQGSIFPRHKVPGLVSAIRRRQVSPFDIDVWDYATDMKLMRVALDPPMVQHLGFKSIVTVNRLSRVFPWSVAFEDLNKERLREDHQRMIHELYGSEEVD